MMRFPPRVLVATSPQRRSVPRDSHAIRVVMLSKALVVGAYQSKAEAIGNKPDIDLTVVVPPKWIEPGRVTTLERSYTSSYNLIVTPIRFNSHFHYHYYPRIGHILNQTRPDVFHIDEEPYNLATWHALRHGRRVGAGIVFFTWQNIYRQLPPPFSWLERYVLAHTDHAICGITGAVEVLRKKGYRGPATVIPQFGPDPDLFTPTRGERPERPFTVGYAGRILERKGLRDLLHACAGLDGDWQLRLIGEGEFQPKLAQEARALGVAERVVFVPPVASTAMPEALRALDAFVLPSRTLPTWKEQFGRVLPEAMACGVPTIGSDSGELPNVIGDAGLIFPEADVAALRAHLARLMAEPGQRADLAERGRARVLAEYTQGAIAARTAEVYRAVAGRAP